MIHGYSRGYDQYDQLTALGICLITYLSKALEAYEFADGCMYDACLPLDVETSPPPLVLEGGKVNPVPCLARLHHPPSAASST